MITTVGRQRLASHAASVNPGKEVMTHLALGTSVVADAIGDLALGAEFYRVAFDSIYQDDVGTFGTVEIAGSDIGAGTYTIGEIGALDAASGGNLLTRDVPDTAPTLTGAQKTTFTVGLINA